MPSILDLPAELRQRILSLSLPDVNHIAQKWPTDISVLSLLHICHRIRNDMGPVLNLWSPALTIVSDPAYVASLTTPNNTITLGGKAFTAPRNPINRLSLNIFHRADPDRIRWTCYCSGDAADWSHPELLPAWLDDGAVVSRLPPGVGAVELDVTPAPTAMRVAAPRYVINPWLHDRRSAQKFLGEHVGDVARLALAVSRRYEGKMPVRLSGRLSTRSEAFVRGVARVCAEQGEGVEVGFVGEWVTTRMAYVAKMSKAVEAVAPRQKVALAEERGEEEFRLKPLRAVEWSQKTKHLFARIADDEGEAEAVEDLRLLAEFMVDASRLTLETLPMESVRRAFLHNVAHDMGFRTASEGEEGSRFVVVRKL